MRAYLTIVSGTRSGTRFDLTESRDYTVGRGLDCHIVLSDPLCSRVHAVLSPAPGGWSVRDCSRNGTFVNGQKIDEAVLDDGHALRMGDTELQFRLGDEPLTAIEESPHDVQDTIQRVVKNAAVRGAAGTEVRTADVESSGDLGALYQLSTQLLGTPQADAVIAATLDVARRRTGASLAGFLWLDDRGHLRPKMVLPSSAADEVRLSRSLTELVVAQGHAVWVANQRSAQPAESLADFADALCVPLLHHDTVLGALHLYLDRGHFRQSHFDFAIAVANVASLALARARKELSLQFDLQQLRAQAAAGEEMLGQSPAMRDLRQRIARVAAAQGCVLIRGESGVGKELVARAIHRAGPRRDRPLVAVNCAAIPVDLMESQLFGHRAGAFTGADRDHVGFFRQADLGTLFLDEIGELSPAGQAKLLRVLEGHPFQPLGSSEEVRVDVRVIAATNQNLQKMVREGTFRQDLYYRLSTLELLVPSLRERGEDVSLLLDHFFEHFRRQHGRPALQLSDAARHRLLAYSWPGNVRQLRNVIDSAVLLAPGARIEPDDLPLHDASGGEWETLRLEHWERKLIHEALQRSGGNVPEAAQLLGIGRATLYRKIEQYGIAR
jgi:two-component system response regulator HydG